MANRFKPLLFQLFSLIGLQLAVSTSGVCANDVDQNSLRARDESGIFLPAPKPAPNLRVTPEMLGRLSQNPTQLDLFRWARKNRPTFPEPTSILADEPPVDRDSMFGDLATRFGIDLSHKPWFLDEKKIDEVIGDPHTLNEMTWAKINLLPLRLRLDFFGILLNRVRDIQLSPNPTTRLEGPIAGETPLIMTMDQDHTIEFANDFRKSVQRFFTPEEVTDLAVFILSYFPFFPESDADWDVWRKRIVHYDLVIGIVVAAFMAATDQGRMKAAGWLIKLPGDMFRIGWYLQTDDLGVGWKQPVFRGGVKGASPAFDVQAGWFQRVHPRPDQVGSAVELSVNEHLIGNFSRNLGWEFSGSGKASYIVSHGNPELDGNWGMNGEVYARRQTDRAARFPVDTIFKVNVSAQPAIGGGTNVELIGQLGFAESSTERAWKNVRNSAQWIRHEVESLRHQQDRVDELVVKVIDLGSGKLSRDEEKALLRSIEIAGYWITESQKNLRRLIRSYNEDCRAYRNQNISRKGWKENQCPLSKHELNDARIEAGLNPVK